MDVKEKITNVKKRKIRIEMPIETDRSLWLMSTHTMGVVTGTIYVFPYSVSRYFLERRASNRNIFVNFILRSGMLKAISDGHILIGLFAFKKSAVFPPSLYQA